MHIKYKLRRTSFVTWVVFLATLVTILISLIAAVFPALLLRTFGGIEDVAGIDSFEIGIWAYPLLITNLIFFGLVFLYAKNILPQLITKSIKFLFNFEVSSRVAFFVITILIGIYISLSVSELFDGKFMPDFYFHFKDWLEIYDVTEFNVWPIGYHLMLFLNNTSLQIFENYKVIPFISSIALLVLTYFVTVEMSKKRFAGIISVLIVLQSQVFLIYDTSVAYPTFWILFYLLSLYLIFKKWPLSPIPFLAGVISKAMTAAFLPMTLFFIYRANIPKQAKVKSVILYAALVILVTVLLSFIGTNIFNLHSAVNVGEFYVHDFWGGFTSLSSALRFDGLIFLFLLPLILGLFHASRRGILHADSIMFLIFGMLLSAPLIDGFSNFINEPYRFVPLVVFFAIGTGILFSKKITEQS